MLLRASDPKQQQAGISLAGRIMRARLRSGDLPTTLRELFACTSLLSDTELAAYAAGIEQHVWSAAELGEYASLLDTQRGWEATAEAYAAGFPRGTGESLSWFDNPVPAPRPRVVHRDTPLARP